MWNSLVNPDKVVMYELHEGVVLEEKHLLQQLASPRLDAAAAAGDANAAAAAAGDASAADGRALLVNDTSSSLKDLHVRDSVSCARFEVYQSVDNCRQDGTAIDAGTEELPAAAALAAATAELKATVTEGKGAMGAQHSEQDVASGAAVQAAAMKKDQTQNPKVSSSVIRMRCPLNFSMYKPRLCAWDEPASW